MKFLNKILLICAIAIMVMPLVMFAQDSTTAINGLDTNLIDSIMSYLTAKWPVISTIGSFLFLASEILGSIPSIKANAVYQLIFGVLKDLFGKKTIVPILVFATSSALLFSSCHHGGIPQKDNITKQDSVLTTDSTWVRDTAFSIPGYSADTIIPISFFDSIYQRHANGKFIVSDIHKGNIDNKVSVNNGQVHFNCSTDSLQERINWLTTHQIIKQNFRTITITKTVTNYITVFKIPKWVWYLIGFNVIFFGWKLASNFLFPGSSSIDLIKHWFTAWKS